MSMRGYRMIPDLEEMKKRFPVGMRVFETIFYGWGTVEGIEETEGLEGVLVRFDKDGERHLETGASLINEFEWDRIMKGANA